MPKPRSRERLDLKDVITHFLDISKLQEAISDEVEKAIQDITLELENLPKYLGAEATAEGILISISADKSPHVDTLFDELHLNVPWAEVLHLTDDSDSIHYTREGYAKMAAVLDVLAARMREYAATVPGVTDSEVENHGTPPPDLGPMEVGLWSDGSKPKPTAAFLHSVTEKAILRDALDRYSKHHPANPAS